MMTLLEVKDKRPETDVFILDEGSLIVFYPHTEEATAWREEFIPEDCPSIGYGFVVESRYAAAIVAGMVEVGLNLSMGVPN